MPEQTAPRPERSAEPQWPTYSRRSDVWDLVEDGGAVCACRWVEILETQRDFWGTLRTQTGVCPDCGAIWDWCA